MKIDRFAHDDYAVLTLKGEFDTLYCPLFQEEVDALSEHGVHHVILNMRLVKFINSTAMGAIIKSHKLTQSNGGALLISSPSPAVRAVVESLGIDSIVDVFDSDDEAVKQVTQLLNQRELAADAPVDDEKAQIGLVDDAGTPQSLVGLMRNADGQQLQFTWGGDSDGYSPERAGQLFEDGRSLDLRFRVNLAKRDNFEVKCRVSEVATSGEEARVTATYVEIADSDREALTQFAADMAFLKQQLPGTAR